MPSSRTTHDADYERYLLWTFGHSVGIHKRHKNHKKFMLHAVRTTSTFTTMTQRQQGHMYGHYQTLTSNAKGTILSVIAIILISLKMLTSLLHCSLPVLL